MEQEVKKSSKKPLIIGLAIAGTVVIAAVAAALIMPMFIAKETRTKGRDRKPSYKYATKYDLELNKADYGVYEKWSVSKREQDDKIYLDVWNGGQKDEPVQYLSFRVYDSASDARKAYKNILISYKDYDDDIVLGDNWFTGWEPGVCDAFIYEMVYLQDNVIIFADLDIESAWAYDDWDDEDTTDYTGPTQSYFDRSTLKDYILDNSEDICDFVMHDILDY